jgi:DNA-binding response OmpR family regulator
LLRFPPIEGLVLTADSRFTAPEIRPPRVLVIDDDPAGLETVATALENRDIEVQRLVEPAKCLVEAAKFQPALVLVNLGIKKVGGRVVIAGLRKEARTRTIPIAVLSDSGLEEHLVPAFRWGVVDYLVKPFRDSDADHIVELLKGLPLRTGHHGGTIEATVVDRLLAFFARTRKSGTLILNPGSDLEARAVFSQGELTSCQVGQFTGREALDRMLTVRSGHYVFEETDVLSAEVMMGNEVAMEIGTGTSEDGEIVAAIEVLPEPAKPVGAPPVPLLFVDDDEALVKLFTKVLTANHFEVRSALNGDEGLRMALDFRPEVVIADLAMPILDGWGMLHRLRADHRVAETPVLFLSAHDDYRQSLEALSAGAQDYLSKTVKMDVLVKRVNEVLIPRNGFVGDLRRAGVAKGKVEVIGVQWALRHAAEIVAKGTLSISDGWGTYDVAIEGGKVVAAVARLQKNLLAGDDALAAVVAVHRGDMTFDVNRFPQMSNVTGKVEVALERAAITNNVAEAAAADKNLVSASKLEVDPELYAIYSTLGPASGRAIASQIAEGFTAREIMSHSDLSPIEVEDVLRDLIRRRVLVPKPASA